MADKQRIQFIDLAKGVCILLVILGHCGVNLHLTMLRDVRMPLYFILSGLFFKDYGGWLNFALRKTNKILVPFVFFYLVSYALFYAIGPLWPQYIVAGKCHGITDLWYSRACFNGPLWFLVCLFWTNLIFCAISRYIRWQWLQPIVVIALAAVGLYIGERHILLPLMIDASLSALPYFYLGYLLKRTPILYPTRFDRLCIPVAAMLLVGAWWLADAFSNPYIDLHYNRAVGSLWVAVTVAVMGVGGILMLCKAIGHIPWVSYIGRYSIIALCTHHIVYRPLIILIPNTWVVAAITLAIVTALIPLCIKYIPQFTAQTDLFPLKLRKRSSNG